MTQEAYPTDRKPYFAHRITRLMFKSCAAQRIGQDAVLLVIHIAHTEDAARYQGPVRFWNSQLNEVLGFRSPKSLNNARAKAVEAGWLVYERPHDRADGRYWTTIPPYVERFNDEPIEPFSIPSTEQESEQESDFVGRFGNGKRNRKVTGNDPLPNPDPKPVPITNAHFESWYEIYPRKKSKGDAKKAYPKAIAEIERANKVSTDQAAELLMLWTQQRLPELLNCEQQYRPYPATWLNDQAYRDEITAFGKIAKPDPSHIPFKSKRARA